MLPRTFWGFLPGDKKVVVVGLGRSGRAAATLLKRLGHDVVVSEIEDSPRTRGICGELGRQGVGCELGRHSPQMFGGAGLIVVSPGARADLACLQYAREKGIRVIPEIELAASLCPAKIIAVTGTNGKSTTVSLIGAALRGGGKKAHICGNIGNPFSGEIGNIGRDDIVCLEVSSFQLQTIDKFKPYVAVILNISPNHLNRHRDIGEYFVAKKRIFANQDRRDWLVLNKGDLRLAGLGCGIRPQIKFFPDDLRINGVTLNANQAAALSVAEVFGVSGEGCLEAFRDFGGLEHRLEFVANIRGVDFVNDSKSTTVASLGWALRKISRPIVLIA
ncbi:MAG: Mur ligase family protein, partial [Candidatus Omnitrophota bacterium]